jgi:hypothetical protein
MIFEAWFMRDDDDLGYVTDLLDDSESSETDPPLHDSESSETEHQKPFIPLLSLAISLIVSVAALSVVYFFGDPPTFYMYLGAFVLFLSFETAYALRRIINPGLVSSLDTSLYQVCEVLVPLLLCISIYTLLRSPVANIDGNQLD